VKFVYELNRHQGFEAVCGVKFQPSHKTITNRLQKTGRKIMDLKLHLQRARTMTHLLEHTTQHLPIGHSLIPLNLLMVVCSTEDDIDLTVKGLFASLPYSVAGMRYHFNRLIEEEFLALVSSTADSRVKHVIATPKLKRHFELLASALEVVFLQGWPPPPQLPLK
jgi:hypothetical protein